MVLFVPFNGYTLQFEILQIISSFLLYDCSQKQAIAEQNTFGHYQLLQTKGML